MPRIRQYQSDVPAPQPSGANVASAATIGEAKAKGTEGLLQPIATGVQEFGAKAAQYQEQEETTKLFSDFTHAEAQLHAQWNEVAKSPEALQDPAGVSKQFMEDHVSPVLDSLGEHLNTRGAQNAYARMKASAEADLFKTTAADQSTLAGIAGQRSVLQTMTSVSSAALANPTSAPTFINRWQDFVDSVPDLGPEERSKLLLEGQKQIAVAQIDGLANSNPDAAQQELDSGRLDKYLDAKDKVALAGHITTLKNAALTEQRAQAAEQRRQQKEQFDTASAGIVNTFIKTDDKGQFVGLSIPPDAAKAVANLNLLPGADGGEARAMANMMESVINNPNAQSDPFTYEQFRQRTFNGLTAQEVFQARADNRLSNKDFTFFHEAVTSAAQNPERVRQDRDFSAMMDGLKPFVGGATNLFGQLTKPEANIAFLHFQQEAREVYDAEIAKKTPLAEITPKIEAVASKWSIDKKGAMDALKRVTRTPNVLPAIPQKTPAVQWKPGMSMEDLDRALNGGK